MEGSDVSILFYSPTTPNYNNSCYCFPSPFRRSINIIANRLSSLALSIWEITGFDFFRIPGLVLVTNGSDICTECRLQYDPPFYTPRDTGTTLETYPQDFDDCLTTTHQCDQICIDGWSPVLSYTCGCNNGFNLTSDLRTCAVLFDGNSISFPVPAIVGLAIGLVLLIAFLIFVILMLRSYLSSELHSLPKGILLLLVKIIFLFIIN